MKFKNTVLTAVLCIIAGPTFAQDGASGNSQGGLYVEPGVTYESTGTKIDWPSPLSSSTGNTNGFGLVGRLGIHASEVVFIALDARYTMAGWKDSSTNQSVGSTGYNYGPVVGIQLPDVGPRIWAQYVMDGKLDPADANGYDYSFDKANGYRVGIGFHVQSISLNLEYQALKYKTTVQRGAGIPLNSTLDSSDLTNSGFVASVTFPIEI